MTYSYDLSGNMTKTTDVQGAPGSQAETQCFSYDSLDRLTQAWSALDSRTSDPTTAGNNSEVGGPQPYWTTWKHDDAGNRTSQDQHAVTGGPSSDISTTYAMNDANHPHALSSTTTTGQVSGSSAYTFWPDGSLETSTVNGAQSSLNYGPDGQLTSVQTSAGTSKYVRDADGNILTRTAPTGATTLYLPDQEITISADKSAVTVDRYYSVRGMVIAMRVNNNNPLLLMSDPHGTNEVAVDPVTWTMSRRYLDPFGNPLGAAFGAAWQGDHGFLGKSVNSTTNLTDIGAREYDPTTGRFTSVDPILTPADALQANGYAYADGNPVNLTDPTGLDPGIPSCSGTSAQVLACRNDSYGGAHSSAPSAPGTQSGAWVPSANGAENDWEFKKQMEFAVDDGNGMSLAQTQRYHAIEAAAIQPRMPGFWEDFFAILGPVTVLSSLADLGASDALLPAEDALAGTAADDGVSLSLKYKSGWSGAQRAAADEKVGALNDAAGSGGLRVTQVERSGTSAASRYSRAGGDIPSGADIDHTIDLQLGGLDDLSNMNRSTFP